MAFMQVSIIGAGGLTGKELLSLLKNHPNFEIVHITSNKTEGKTLEEVFPSLGIKRPSLKFKTHSAPIPKDSLVVLATPNEVSLEMAPRLLDGGHKVIDLSGAYRLHDQDKFEKFYGLKHTSFHLMKEVVFGLPELYRERLIRANFVSNPGCYSTSVIIPIYFLGGLRKKLISIVVDSKSGVSGAGGRTEDIGFTFTNTYENFRAYKVLTHQHTPEMEEYSKEGVSILPKIIFTPHLLPVYRGILSTIVFTFEEEIPEEFVQEEYSAIQDEPFLRLLSKPEEVELKNVQFSNYLDLAYRLDGNVLVVVSALDNLVKGAAGQALQNMNLMAGFDETLGILQG
jgi:N-acetyl-gamma-glutamyl-phosphate reductase